MKEESTSVKLINKLKNGGELERKEAAYALYEYDSSEARQALLEALDDPSPEVQIQSIGSLAWLKEHRMRSKILTMYKNTNPEIRAAVAQGIGSIGDKNDIDILLTLARDAVENVCIEAINSIGKVADPSDINFYLSVLFNQVTSPMVLKEILRSFSMNGNMEEILAAIKHPNPEVRGFAVSLLKDKSGAEVADLAVLGLDDPASEVRFEALKVLGQMVKQNDVKVKVMALSTDDSPLIRREVAELIANFSDAEAEKILINLLGDSDPYVRKSAGIALGKRGNVISAQRLIQAIETEDILNVKVSMVLGLTKINLPFVYDKLKDLCKADEPGVRIIALRGLFELNADDAVKLAEELTKNDADDWARGQAASELAKYLGMSALPLLKELAVSGNTPAKSSVAEALGGIKTEDSVEVLFVLSRDSHSQVRSLAYESLGKINTEKAKEFLIAGIKDKDPDVRWSVVTTMGKTGNKDFVQFLNHLASDDISTYRGKISDAVLNAIKLLS